MPNEQPPAISRRQIRTRLRELRAERRETQQQVADAFGWSAAKVMRIENGKTPVSVSDLTALLSHYRVTDEGEVRRLQALARKAKSPGLAKKYGNALSAEFQEFLENEDAAQEIWSYETNLVPGPLQTREYARAALTLYVDPEKEKDINARVEARLERQEMITEDGGPRAIFIIDEAALHRQVGVEMGVDGVMERQLRHLQVLSKLPNIEIQVMRFGVGLYSKYRIPFVVLDLGEGTDSRLVYLEAHDRSIILYEHETTIEPYVETFERMRGLGTQPERFGDIAEGILKNRARDTGL